MPRLHALGREWRVGSDDVSLPSAIDAVVSVTWFGFLLYLNIHRPACYLDSRLFSMFIYGGMAVSASSGALDLVAIHTAQKGTIINAAPRRRIGGLLSMKLCLDMAGLAMTVLGSRLLYTSDCSHGSSISFVRNLVRAGWAKVVANVAVFGFIFIPMKDKRSLEHNMSSVSTNMESSESLGSVTAKSVIQRCHSLCQIIGIDNQPAISSIANLIVHYFKEDVDVAPSDIMAAMILLEKEQAEKKAQIAGLLEQSSQPSMYCVTRQHWMTIHNASHFLKFACGAYGWPLYVFSKPLAVVALLRVLCASRFIPRPSPSNVKGDTTLLANTAVIKMATGLRDEDLVYITFENKLFQVPFYIALDHKEEAIVVSIRGTLSLEDVFTDLMAFASDGIAIEDVEDGYAHEGMLLSANYIHRALMGFKGQDSTGHPLLQLAHDQLRNQVGPEKAKRYQLVIVGHSLGAGVAAILAILMRQHSQYQDLWCFAYSPPGGLVSLSAARYCEQFVCSVVLNDDIVPRLGLVTAYKLKRRMFEILRDCDIPKHQIMGTWLESLLGLKRCSASGPGSHPPSWSEDPEAQQAVRKFQSVIQAAIDNSEKEVRTHPRMYIPGVVLYIQETQKTKRSESGKGSYELKVTDGSYGIFDDLLISAKVVSDHMPWKVLQVLQSLEKQ